ncbi:MAG: M28 family peptidase [Candidatus Hodarchaeales archaeon]
MTSTEIFEPIIKLADEIGPRVTGSENSSLTIKYLENKFKKLGFIVENQNFDVEIWINIESKVILDQNIIEAIPFGYSGIKEVTGKSLSLVNPNPKQIENLVFKEKIVLYHNSMGAMSAMGGRGVSREDLIQKAIDGEALGFIEVSNKPGGLIERRTLKKKSPIPVAMVSKEDGFKLLRKNAEITLSIKGQTKIVNGTNLIARTEATSSNRILLTSHYDTAPDSPGAFDNGTGIALQLELARLFKNTRDLEFVCFDACKWNFAGSEAYVRKYLSNDKSKPSLVMHFDTVAKPDGTRNGVLANDMRLFGMTKQMMTKYGFKMNLTPMPIFGSDAVTFHKLKIPVFVINQWKSPTFINTPYDTPEKLSVDSLKSSTVIAAVVLENAVKMSKVPAGMGHPPNMGHRHPKMKKQ